LNYKEKNLPLDSMLERRKRFLGPAYRLFYNRPLNIVKGEGVWLFDNNNKRYLDMYNNVAHVGHCHPQVVEAIRKQVGILNTHTRYLHDNVLHYAERLLNKMPDALDVAMFSCTGTEANELALRIARTYTEGTGIIVTEDAYHGNSEAIAEISTEDNEPEDRSDYVVTVPAPDTYRGLYTSKNAAEKYAAHIETAVQTLEKRNIKVAAFIIDTIISSSGVVGAPPGYLRKAAEIVRKAGGLFIADEVQPGFGRTGKSFWGYEPDNFVPDIVTMGKPMGNGHPIAATVIQRPFVEKFSNKTGYFNTFGGNPVSCAAAMAVMEVIENEDLQDNALKVGTYLKEGIKSIAEQYSLIGDVRGSGFFIAIEMIEDSKKNPATKTATKIVQELKERGILTNTIGPDENILKLRPPMVFTEENATFFLEQLENVVKKFS
jgi:4-aminobutyrate aminotransferase-like enzyme|tara:strand:+ start:66975 stop:68270 length:1296 start_codon:yes stop_codon:yes gene_type:complete